MASSFGKLVSKKVHVKPCLCWCLHVSVCPACSQSDQWPIWGGGGGGHTAPPRLLLHLPICADSSCLVCQGLSLTHELRKRREVAALVHRTVVVQHIPLICNLILVDA